jgi:hypothetical protein
MHVDAVIHRNLEQGSPEWHEARRGLMTASEMNLVLTPTLKPSNSDKTRLHVYEIAAQRITGWTEPTYIGDAMLRGHADEITARDRYSDEIEPLEELGFITRDFGAFTLGYSPDGAGVLGNFGMECKSRIQKHQVRTIVEHEIPDEYMLQIQTGLLITGWDYMEFISYSAGLPMVVIQQEPLPEYATAIMAAALDFEVKVQKAIKTFTGRKTTARLFDTQRDEEAQEIYLA